MDYTNYKVEDFATDDLFIQWVLHNDLEASRFWLTFVAAHPDLRPTIEQARALLLNLEKARRPSSSSGQVEKIWQNISAEAFQEDAAHHPRFSFMRIAATLSLLALMAFAIWQFLPERSDARFFPVSAETSPEGFIEEFNTTGATIRMHLSDGSIVSLANHSRLRYRQDYSADSVRQVFLDGEAFFEISKNQQQPFLVYANEVVTKVLGTSFRVKAYESEQSILVSVTEGKVSVYSSKGQETKPHDSIESSVNGVVLTSNQQVVYSRQDDAFNRSLVQMPLVVKEFTSGVDFNFHNVPISQVFVTLSHAYGVEIIFQEEVMKDCYITVPMAQDDPLFEKLKIICRTIGATYELIDAKIVINSKGCGSS